MSAAYTVHLCLCATVLEDGMLWSGSVTQSLLYFVLVPVIQTTFKRILFQGYCKTADEPTPL